MTAIIHPYMKVPNNMTNIDMSLPEVVYDVISPYPVLLIVVVAQ
jgi:hypothetical protein